MFSKYLPISSLTLSWKFLFPRRICGIKLPEKFLGIWVISCNKTLSFSVSGRWSNLSEITSIIYAGGCLSACCQIWEKPQILAIARVFAFSLLKQNILDF